MPVQALTWAEEDHMALACGVAAAAAGLQNRCAAFRVAGGFDSRPPPLT
jgi:hypothetical protein